MTQNKLDRGSSVTELGAGRKVPAPLAAYDVNHFHHGFAAPISPSTRLVPTKIDTNPTQLSMRARRYEAAQSS